MLDTPNEPSPLSPATTALLDIAEMQRSDPVDAATNLVFLAERIRNMTEIAPAFRATVRDARNAADCGLPIGTPGEAELLAVTDAAAAMVEAHTALLDALCAATDFLRGEGLPGIRI
jgi:hypothetical protein